MATEVQPEAEYWSGMAQVRPAAGPVVIEAASVLTATGARPGGVFVGRVGVDGMTGATPNRVPGDELPGAPRPAAGASLTRTGPATVIYAVASLEPGAGTGGIYGARLTVRAGSKSWRVLVLSPTVLCGATSTTAPPCARMTTRFLDRVDEIYDGAS